jgi:hypothetical protein
MEVKANVVPAPIQLMLKKFDISWHASAPSVLSIRSVDHSFGRRSSADKKCLREKSI